MSWLNKLKGALKKTSNTISDGITNILHKKKLDDTSIAEIEDILIMSDIGVPTTNIITTAIKEMKFLKEEITPDALKTKLSITINQIISENQKEFAITNGKLNVVLVCGVNGNGKTTTIGKLASSYVNQGKKVLIAACDTFRAAAKDQLAAWANKSNCGILLGTENQDPASLAYQAVEQAIKNNIDILFIDTAGRLHNHTNLMLELTKIIKVIQKLDPTAPHHSLLVIDSTTGQNAFNQVKHFKDSANVTGLIVTKLDGTAKAGVLVGLSSQFKLPIYFIGIGEQIDDIKEFDSLEFSRAMVGL